jgi:hypothetical protein
VSGCTSTVSDDQVVTVNSLPQKPLIHISNGSNFCTDGSKKLTSSISGDSYEWRNVVGKLVGSTKDIEVSSAGTYTVKVTSGTCATTSDSKQVTIQPLTVPVIQHNGPVLRVNAHASGHQWYVDGHKIDGATSASHVPTRAGKYTIETVSQDGCSARSLAHLVTAVDVPTLDGEFMVFPNPNDGHFQIKKPSGVQIEELVVYDMLGHVHHRLKTKQTEVNVQGLAGGMYVLEIITEPKEGYVLSRTKKFMVVRDR